MYIHVFSGIPTGSQQLGKHVFCFDKVVDRNSNVQFSLGNPFGVGTRAFKAGTLNFQEVTEVKEKAVDKVFGRLGTWGVPKFETDEVKGLGV